LLGESGTGKELAARAVHEHSPRRTGPFVVFDCGAASDTLIESDLFGHKRGAFTGADTDRPGAFARAHGGTLFLDEIGDLPTALQPKLLRLAEQGEVTPLGARAGERYDVRIVAATHRDLWSEVGRGTFRGDLYYRLAVVEARLPALRERPEDVLTLARAFLESHGVTLENPNAPAFHRLTAYGWPGNVRELRNVLMRAVALAPPNPRFEDLPILFRPDSVGAEQPPLARADTAYHEAKAAILARFDRDYLTDLMRREGSNLAQAARVAGIERKHLYKVLERAGLLPVRSKPEAH
jgi:DNA-binding NtrC family response regulator